ncbi:carboxylesterase family protein [Nonomuraea turkmeniaca]|uniref:Carboxylesterase family protein n=1 Tax=Nonomuraea turkmeniaca TaxID=103838 RepID=A0A5S4F9I1_9ACTN|nr:carboxylesterase family protein [Nonomuraea turkmeniaca]TMR13601.1 carboxylesterase family protein [Nonomuraea turkmeniaca]
MSTSAGPEVPTTAGTVRGQRERGLAVFRGIPFAQPPVGPARFAAPQRAPGWDGVRDAFAYGPPPPQGTMRGLPLSTGGPVGDDWLTLNVWTPEPGPGAGLPVMVWIYGGAYVFGMSGDPGFDGTLLAAAGVVVVTCNHRVGMEGFAHIGGAPANRGLLDQVAALEWVQENIEAFGGDPGRVTVFAQSSGAGSIATLMSMPRTAGLFQRGIAQSVPGTFFSAELATDITAVVAGELGLSATTEDLSGVAPDRLAAAGDAVTAKMHLYEDRWGAVAHTPTIFTPVVDGEVLSTTPWQALANGAGRDIELIVGHNRDECRLFVALGGLLGQVTDEQAAAALRVFAPDGGDGYRAALPAADAGELFELVQSDWLFRMPSLHLAEAQAAGGGRAHLYELTWPAPGMGGMLGACHGLDVPLTFGVFDAGLGAGLMGDQVSPEGEALSQHIRTAWTTFAATGDPGWPAYDPEHRRTQVLDTEPAVTTYPEETSRRLWQDHTFAPLLRL